VEEREILDRIHGLVAESHQLRELREHGDVSEDAELARLEELEQGIESMWALLRRRRALRAAGLDPDSPDPTDGVGPEISVDTPGVRSQAG
jgi:hypothetical protein